MMVTGWATELPNRQLFSVTTHVPNLDYNWGIAAVVPVRLSTKEQLGMTTLNIELDGQLEADLREAVACAGVRRQDFVREALRRQLALVRLNALQKELAPYAQARGWFTDDDVFREIS